MRLASSSGTPAGHLVVALLFPRAADGLRGPPAARRESRNKQVFRWMGPEGFEPPTGSFEGFCSVP
jgi:hypothetical protein